jgi:hypothetical protein
MSRRLLSVAALCGLLAACASTPTLPEGQAIPGTAAPEVGIPTETPPLQTGPGTPGAPQAGASQPATGAPATGIVSLTEKEARERVARLLPANVSDRGGWAGDIALAFGALKLPMSRENICAAMSVIEQESTWQSDPVVPGLGHIVWDQMYAKAARYGVPQFAVDVAMLKRSPDGRTYKARIDALRTEREMNLVYEDMVSELPEAARALGGKNPIKTGGPMQVSVDFAEAQIREKPYPYTRKDSVRHEVFSRRGGVYFGIAMLLDYPASYTSAKYRFADYNAGRYSSRNAAFQKAAARVTGRKLVLDGDLLRYDDGVPDKAASATMLALLTVSAKLGMKEAEIQRDLKLEKTAAFTQTPLWQRLFALTDRMSGGPMPREAMPQIELHSPKITRKLTTEWFANRVDGRYQGCLARG